MCGRHQLERERESRFLDCSFALALIESADPSVARRRCKGSRERKGDADARECSLRRREERTKKERREVSQSERKRRKQFCGERERERDKED